ncbi:MAG: alpha/beta hydrolase [Actinobacteria bacterium]|nr:alpha/beta hydrolase [Actinomycetota bacterium]
MFLTCAGSGSPTVVLISGTAGGADEWTELPAGSAAASARPVFSALAATTRVCSYDRPGTIRNDGSPTPTTPVTQPTNALQGVQDLDRLLAAGGETGPYLLVGASWGGLIAQLFARAHPDDVDGLVLVDSASAFLRETLSPTQWDAWMAVNTAAHDRAPEAESPAYEQALREMAAAPPPRSIPATVLSSDQPWDLGVTPGASTWPAWLAAQADLADALHATHVSITHSGHGIQVEQPALVSEAIRAVLDSARR